MRTKKGISLIMLIIIIIIIIILVGAVIMNLVINNPIERANEATFKNNIKEINNEFVTWSTNELIYTNGNLDIATLNATKDSGTYIQDEEFLMLEDILPSIKESYINKIAIEEGKIKYIGTDEKEKQWAIEIGIDLGKDASQGAVVPIEIVTGWEHTMVLMSDGTVKAWGANYDGQLGIGDDGTYDWDRFIPLDVTELTNVKQLVSTGSTVLVLLNDGTVKGFGYTRDGQLGEITTADKYLPITLSGLTDVKQLVTGHYQTFALLNDGTVKFMRMEL